MSARATTIGFSLLALFLAVVPLTAANEYSLRLFMIFLIYAIVSVGLNVLVGRAEQRPNGPLERAGLASASSAVMAGPVRATTIAGKVVSNGLGRA